MFHPVLLSLPQNIDWEIKEHSFLIKHGSKRLILGPLSPRLQKALVKLTTVRCTEDELQKIVNRTADDSDLRMLYYCIRKLRMAGLLCQTVANRHNLLATFHQCSGDDSRLMDRRKQYALSRFVYLRFKEDGAILRTPLSRGWVVLYDSLGFQVLMNMRTPFRMRQLAARLPNLHRRTLDSLLNLMLHEQFLEAADIQNPSMMLWDFHDLLFHSQSREGRNIKPVGGTFRFAGKINPLPAVKPRVQTETTSLKRAPLSNDSFTRLLEKRKSIRTFDDSRPITIQQIGHFLYRVGRITNIVQPDSSNLQPYSVAKRPYPGGGACYELEIYLTVRTCKRLNAGFYYYDAKDHALSKISEPTTDTEQLLLNARKANGHSVPQVLITLAARFGRVSWKYESMAYATILKDVGVLFQTMYLVATQMGLAPCALGGGDSDLFSRIAGTNYYEETSVGEFMLGSKKRKS